MTISIRDEELLDEYLERFGPGQKAFQKVSVDSEASILERSSRLNPGEPKDNQQASDLICEIGKNMRAHLDQLSGRKQ
jgi:hypothetical protein